MFIFRTLLDRPWALLDTDEKPGGGTDETPAEETETNDDDEGKTFDAAYVKKLREEAAGYRTRAQAAEGKVAEHEEAKKTDDEKTADRLSKAEDRASYADKLDVALDKAPEGMSAAQIRKLAKRLTGKTREELEADAEELFADFTPSGGSGEETPGSKPRERMRPGAAPSSEPEENDPRKLAEAVPRF